MSKTNGEVVKQNGYEIPIGTRVWITGWVAGQLEVLFDTPTATSRSVVHPSIIKPDSVLDNADKIRELLGEATYEAEAIGSSNDFGTRPAELAGYLANSIESSLNAALFMLGKLQ